MIREVFEKFCREHEWDSPEQLLEEAQFQTIWSFIELTCKEYGRLMCDKQKEICARNAVVKQQYKNNNEEIVTNSMQLYNIDKYDSYYFDVEIYADSNSILNAPYPDELQGNN